MINPIKNNAGCLHIFSLLKIFRKLHFCVKQETSNYCTSSSTSKKHLYCGGNMLLFYFVYFVDAFNSATHFLDTRKDFHMKQQQKCSTMTCTTPIWHLHRARSNKEVGHVVPKFDGVQKQQQKMQHDDL